MRQHTRLRWQGVVTVVMTTAVFIVSWCPNLVVGVTSLTLKLHYNTSTWRTTQFLLNLNIMANFFIYCLTVPSFRECLRHKLQGALRTVKQVVVRALRTVLGSRRRRTLPHVVWKQLQSVDQIEEERGSEGGGQRHSSHSVGSDRHSIEISDGRSNSNYTELSINTCTP